ncbi:hypothetical protein [Streptomyces sp. NPDC048272]|uniref:hypothetical protein n=1 Tax=Streptomyces sp. NPDC048272 TaxID=3154616 RepID=UPI00341B6A7F
MNPALLASIAKARVFFLFAGFAWLFGLVPTAPNRVLVAALVVAAVLVEAYLDGHRIAPHRTTTSPRHPA